MKQIPLTQGYKTTVDSELYDTIAMYKWSYCRGYAVAEINGKSVRLHRLVAQLLGWPTENVIDHKDQDPLNNRASNLRVASTGENAINSGIQRRNTSGYRGVHWDKQKRKWSAQIGVNGKQYHLGRFDDKESAYKWRCIAAQAWFGDFEPQHHYKVPEHLPQNVYRAGNKFAARLLLNGSRKHLGYYATPEEASAAVLRAKSGGSANLQLSH